MNSEEPFGGKVFVLGGDFRQIPPVVKGGSRALIITRSLKSSFIWNQFQKFRLSINMRANGDTLFCEWLLQIGDGRISKPALALTNYSINIPPQYLSLMMLSVTFSEFLLMLAMPFDFVIMLSSAQRMIKWIM